MIGPKGGRGSGGPLFGGGALGPGITVKRIDTSRSPAHCYTELILEILVDHHVTDLNDLMQKLQNLMKPQPGISMTTAASSSVGVVDLMQDASIEEAPLPDEDLNGDGKFDDELLAAIEKRFDDVDQALRLLVDG